MYVGVKLGNDPPAPSSKSSITTISRRKTSSPTLTILKKRLPQLLFQAELAYFSYKGCMVKQTDKLFM